MTNFDDHAEDYRALVSRAASLSGEDVEYFVGYKLDRIQRLYANCSPPARLLDLGCGVGLLTESLARAWPRSQVMGIDVSSKSLERAASRCAGLGNVAWRLYSDHTLPAGTDRADLVILANLLHHVEPTARPALFEGVVLPALAAGGRIVIFEHNPYNPFARLAVRLCPFDQGVRLIGLRAAIRLLRRQGFRVIRQDYIVFFPRFLRFLRGLEQHIGWLPLGAQYMVVAEREPRP